MRIGTMQVLNLLRLLGEAAWLYPWSLAVGAWLGGTAHKLLEFLALLAILLLAAVGTQWTVRPHSHPGLTRGIFVGLGALVACLVALGQTPILSVGGGISQAWELLSREGYGGRAVLGAAVAVFLWWRGITVGRSKPHSWNLEDEFRTGILAMAGLLVIVVMAGENAGVGQETLVPSVLLLIFSGLVGVPLARVVDESERPRHADSPSLSPGGPWLTMLLGVVGTVLLVTLVLAQIFTFQRIGLLFEPLRGPLDALLWALIYLVALPLGLLASVVIYVWRLVIRPGGAPAQLEPPDMNWLDEMRRQSQGGAAAPELLLALKVGLALLLGLVVVAILVQAVHRFSDWWDNDEVEEARGYLASRPSLKELLQWLLLRLRPVRSRVREDPGGLAVVVRPEQGIRGVYRQFLSLGIKVGHGRRAPETPREYQGRLSRERLSGVEEVDLITESYNLERYGIAELGSPHVGVAAAALARLRELWENESAHELPGNREIGGSELNDEGKGS